MLHEYIDAAPAGLKLFCKRLQPAEFSRYRLFSELLLNFASARQFEIDVQKRKAILNSTDTGLIIHLQPYFLKFVVYYFKQPNGVLFGFHQYQHIIHVSNVVFHSVLLLNDVI